MVGLHEFPRQADGALRGTRQAGRGSSRSRDRRQARPHQADRKTWPHRVRPGSDHRQGGQPVRSIIPMCRPAVYDYASQWLEGCRVRGLKGSTRRAYTTIMAVHLVPAFGHLHLSQIDRKAVKAFVHQKLQEPIPLSRKDATKTKPRSPRTVLHCLCVLSALFNAAIEDDYPVVNPALNPGKILRTKGTSEDIDPLDREEERCFSPAVAGLRPPLLSLLLYPTPDRLPVWARRLRCNLGILISEGSSSAFGATSPMAI